MDCVPFKHRDTLLARLKKFISHDLFEGICLNSRLRYKSCPIQKIEHVRTDDTVLFDDVTKLKFSEVKVGNLFGPLWSKHWFRLEVQVPDSWCGQKVCLVWVTHGESQVWVDDKPVQGLSLMKKRHFYTVTENASINNLNHTIYVEMSCNGFYTDFNDAPPDYCATLTTAEIRTFDRKVFQLMMDIQVLYELALHLPKDTTRPDEILLVANDAINACVLGDTESYERARNIASRILRQKNGDGGHIIHAVGYSNIDTAWLWPQRKTPMKCVSSWSSVLSLMERFPFKHAFTQPQQLVWVRERYPEFYTRVEQQIRNGRLIPVGATWIEMDANLPNGECLIRQFLYGQRFLMKEFGIKCSDLWILDSFGYPAQLPQIMLHCDVTRFVSIKLSWNSVNKFPHSTFWWQGLDGRRVLTHFPPGTNYHKEATVQELLEVEKVFSDAGRSNSSLFLFGHGNAGLGPTEEMLERLKRMEDLKGLPRVQLSSPAEFYASVEADTDKLCTWVGELYLERHQATYTSQAQVKKRNRRAESLLHDVDLWTSIVSVLVDSYKHPSSELERIWKQLLINQFHDVLPGSAHPEVYKDFHAQHDEIESFAESETKAALDALFATDEKVTALGLRQKKLKGKDWTDHDVIAVNSLSWKRKEVVILPKPPNGLHKYRTKPNYSLVEVPSCGFSNLKQSPVRFPVSVTKKGTNITLRNHHLEVTIDKCGRITNLWKPETEKNFFEKESQFVVYDDFPLYRDAWDSMDYNLQTRKPVDNVTQDAKIIESTPLRATVEVRLRISGSSEIRQHIILDTECPFIRFHTQVSWHESHKFLKVEFPTSILSQEASYDIQFGHIKRPTNYNTSWDSAKYEVCGHKWAAMSEYNRGVAILNDCKYGHSCVGGTMRLSIVRAPTAPDPHTDIGNHSFTYAVMPFTGSLQDFGVIQQAYSLNSPFRLHYSPTCSQTLHSSVFWLDTDSVILETVKMAEDEPDVIVLRMYEAYGGHVTAKLMTSLPVREARLCNGLEEKLIDKNGLLSLSLGRPTTLKMQFNAFQLNSVLLYLRR